MTVGSEILADSPDGYWPLTGDLNDYSGNGNHLTVHQAGTYEAGLYYPFGREGTRGTAVYDTGISLPGGAWTVEFMVERKDPISGPLPWGIVWDGDEETGFGVWPEVYTTGALRWTTAGNTGFGYVPDSAHHFIAVFDGGDLTVYRGISTDGEPSGIVSTYYLGSVSPSGTLKIGNAGGAMYAHVAVFDHALSFARVEAHLSGFHIESGPEPDADPIDPLASDGPLPSSTPFYGAAWTVDASGGTTGAVASGSFVTDHTDVLAALEMDVTGGDPPECIEPLPNVLSTEVTLPAGFSSSGARVALGWSDSGTWPVIGAYVEGANAGVGVLESDGSFESTATGGVDVSAGAHTLTVRRSGGGSGDGGYLEVWWDGTWVGAGPAGTMVGAETYAYLLSISPCLLGPCFAVAENTANDTFEFTDLAFSIGDAEYGGLDEPELEGGLARITGADDNVYVGGLDALDLSGGVQDPINSDMLLDVHVGGLEAPPLTGGLAYCYTEPSVPSPMPPSTPGFQYGPPSADLTVDGFADALKGTSASRVMNAGGSGNFEVLPPGPSAGDEVTISAGSPIFTGYASVSDHVVAVGEEDVQTVSVDLISLLEADFTDTVVWPDIAASEPIRLGRPPQDDRTWDWHSNAGVYDRAELISSVGGNNALYGTEDENHPYPDNWPDPYSKWMWDRNPDQDGIPEGWCYFRVHHGILFAKPLAMFVCAWDYAEVHYDGQLMITADQPGATFRQDFDIDWDYHLITIAAYTEGGKAGVNFTLMPKEKHGLTPSVMNSRGGWECLSYPQKPLRFTVGKVLERLIQEAKDRGAPAGNWTLEFDKDTDSAGNPWPTDDSVISTRVGMTYWDVLNMLAEDRIDFRASPAGRSLYAYVKGQPPRSVGNPWTAGVDLADLVEDTSTR